MRWKAVLPTLAVVAAVALCTVLFLDTAVERFVERAGTLANHAKVELDSAEVSLRELSVTLHRLQVTDRDRPMTNAVEVDSLTFDLAAKPLSWMKIIIENGEISGVRTGTPRRSSGALPGRGARAAEIEVAAKAGEATKQAAKFSMTNLKEQYDPKKLVNKEDLASYRKIQEERARVESLSRQWEARVDDLKAEQKAQELRTWINAAKSRDYKGPQGILEAKRTLDEAKRHREELLAMKREAAALRQALSAEIAAARETVKTVDRLKSEDLKGQLGKLKAGAFSAEGIGRGLVGPEWFGKVEQGVKWIRKAREYIPEGGEDVKPAPPPREGRDITFPFRHRWPAFHLVRARVTGATPGERPLEYAGTLSDVTSDPPAVGRPIALDLASARGEDGRAFTFRGELDYTDVEARERIELRYSGMPLAGTKLGTVGAPVSIASGRGALDVNLEARGEGVVGTVAFTAEPVALRQELTPEQAGNRFLAILNDVLTKMTVMRVTIAVSGRLAKPDFKLSTNIDDQLKNAVNLVLKKELDELKRAYRARIDGLVDAERNKLKGQVDAKAAGALNRLGVKDASLGAVEKEVDQAIEELKARGQQSVVPAGDTGKDAAKEGLKKLKKLF